VAVPVSIHRQRIDGVHGVARNYEGAHQQPAVEFDADRDLGRLPSVRRHHLMQAGKALDALWHAPLGQRLPACVHHTHVVVALGPVDPDEDHSSSFPR